MSNSRARKFQKDLNGGLTALILLGILERSSTDLYGYEIARRLQAGRVDEPPVKEGTIYPVLRGLAAAGLLSSRIVPSYSGPPRRYYRITPEGRASLATWRGIWTRTRDFVDACLHGADEGTP